MPTESAPHRLARLLADAFDVDIQVFTEQALARLRETPAGTQLAAWASANRPGFEALIRIASVVARRVPRDRGIVSDAIADALSRLPVQFRRAFVEQVNPRSLIPPEGPRSVADFELMQASCLDPELLQQWLEAKPLKGDTTGESLRLVRSCLIADWIKQGRVRRLDYKALKLRPDEETPGFLHMRVGRQALLRGMKREGSLVLRVGWVLDPDTVPAFLVWLANPTDKKVASVARDPDVLTLVAEVATDEALSFIADLIGPEYPAIIRRVREDGRVDQKAVDEALRRRKAPKNRAALLKMLARLAESDRRAVDDQA
jgi:hypothetical protein